MRCQRDVPGGTTGGHGDTGTAQGDMALRLFDWTQRVADIWRGSNNGLRREILESICLNRTLSDVTLCTQTRRPFDVFAERPICHDGRGNWRSFEPYLGAYVGAFTRPEPHLIALDRLARQCA